MKKSFLKSSLLALLAMFSVNASALEIELQSVTAQSGGDAVDVEIYATIGANATTMNTLQFQILKEGLPAGLEITDLALNSEVFTGSKAAATLVSKKNFWGFTLDNDDPFGGTVSDGTKILMGTFKLKVPAGVDNGPISATLTKMLIANSANDANSEDLGSATATWTFTVGEATGINEVSAQNVNAPIYSISGARMNGNLQKGIYVQNGRKFIVK
jgi:hypothetical protein